MFQIFLSHNARDRAWCEWLKTSAAEIGVSAYLAEHDVQPGTNLAAKLIKAIEASDALVVLISDNSVEAPYVHQEIGYALKAGKLIVPLVQPGIHDDKLAMLRGVEYIPFDFDHPHEGHRQLRIALSQLVDQQQRRKDRDAALVALAVLGIIFLALGNE
jgi:hypothetical protein